MNGKKLGQYGGMLMFSAGIVLPVLWPRLPTPRQSDLRVSAPRIEIMIPAYLELSTIGAKVQDCLAEADRYEGEVVLTVVASDTETAEAARAASPNVRVLDTERDGKASAINHAVQMSDADVCVITDANCQIGPPGWLTHTVRDLDVVDLVSCHKLEVGSADRVFWGYERLAKSRGDQGGLWPNPMLAIVGEYVAFRRSDFRPIARDSISDDTVLAIDFASRGLTPGVSARLYSEETTSLPAEHWERRKRIAHGQMVIVLTRLPDLVRTPLGRQFVAHKLYRLTVGNLGYWTWLLCGLRRGSPTSITLTALTGYATIRYSGLARSTVKVHPLLVPFAMQALPPCAVARILTSRFRRRPHGAVWRKVPR